jgi:glycosyltransferase involved in cell wall biosynthesis
VRPLLSICVPTFNQPHRYRLFLSEISKTKHKEKFEIIVCDDSHDNSSALITDEYFHELPIYHHVRSNDRGIDTALKFLLEKANGEYIWFFGDDVPFPEKIDALIEKLEEPNDFKFIWLNSEDETDKNSKTFNVSQNTTLPNNDALLQFDMGLLGFITAVILKRDAARLALLDIDEYIGSSFVLLHIVFVALGTQGSLTIFGDSYFKSLPKPSGEKRWYNQIEVFGINLYSIAQKDRGVFSKHALDRALDDNIVRVLKSMLVERALGYVTGFGDISFNHYRFVPIYWRRIRFWSLWPLLLLPRSILRIAYIMFIAKKGAINGIR